MKKKTKKSVYDPFLNKKISIDNEPYKEYTGLLESKNHKMNKSKSKKSPQQSKSFFKTLGGAFMSDIVWLSVSFSLLIATILFYFQVLQPKIITNIGAKAQDQVFKVQNDLSGKIKNFSETRSEIISKNTQSLTGVCSEDQLYRDRDVDKSLVSSLEKQLIPDSSLENLDRYSVFTSKEIQEEYKNYYNQYKINISEISNEIESLAEFINFKEYENDWISNCVLLNESINVSRDLDTICNQPSQNINEADFPNLFLEIQEISSKQNELCLEWNERLTKFSFTPVSAAQTRLDWLTLMSQVTVIDSELINIFDQSSQKIDPAVFQNQTNTTTENIDNIVNSKKGIRNIWYLLDIKL